MTPPVHLLMHQYGEALEAGADRERLFKMFRETDPELQGFAQFQATVTLNHTTDRLLREQVKTNMLLQAQYNLIATIAGALGLGDDDEEGAELPPDAGDVAGVVEAGHAPGGDNGADDFSQLTPEVAAQMLPGIDNGTIPLPPEVEAQVRQLAAQAPPPAPEAPAKKAAPKRARKKAPAKKAAPKRAAKKAPAKA